MLRQSLQIRRIGLDDAGHGRGVPEGDVQEEVGRGAAFDEEARHLRPGQDVPLRRRAVVVHVPGVDLGAVIEEEGGDLRRGRVVQGPQPVTARFVDHGGVGGDQLAQALETAQACSRVGVDGGAPVDEEVGEAVAVQIAGVARVQGREAARPPAALLVDVGPEGEQQVDHAAVLAASGEDDGRSVETALVGGGGQGRVGLQAGADDLLVSGLDGGEERRRIVGGGGLGQGAKAPLER